MFETLPGDRRCTKVSTEAGLLRRALVSFLPVVTATSLVIAFVYATEQQNLRTGANDPQVQLAEDAAARLDAGANPNDVLPSQPVDMARSLAPFLIVFDRGGKPVASSAQLEGTTPQPPPGVLTAVSGSRRNQLTWAPRPEVREAAVIVAYRDGHVLVGRSLRLVEERETALGQLAIVFLVALIVVTGLVSLGVAWATASGRARQPQSPGPSQPAARGS